MATAKESSPPKAVTRPLLAAPLRRQAPRRVSGRWSEDGSMSPTGSGTSLTITSLLSLPGSNGGVGLLNQMSSSTTLVAHSRAY